MHLPASCADFQRAQGLTRRTVLKGLGVVGAASVVTTVFGEAVRQTAFADTAGGNVLVVLSLRGGVDGLGLVVPHGDSAYYTARPRLAVPKESLLAADSMFGLHPDLTSLQWLWDRGEIAAVHAVGLPHPNRSHFAAMEEIEDADPLSALRQGWVNRMIGLGSQKSSVEAVQINSSSMPALLAGPSPTLSLDNVRGLQILGMYANGGGPKRRRQLEILWGADSGLIGAAGREAVALSDTFHARSVTGGPANGVTYPSQAPDLSNALANTAELIRAEIGTQVVAIDYGSWDMHDNYGTLGEGRMSAMTKGLALSLDAFMRDLGDLRSRVTVVTTSEFGRRVAENGNWGLDHGWGNVMLVMGGGVRGGKYYANWPGLGEGKLVNGDLQVTTDYRNVFAELITKSFPEKPLSSVFPGLSYKPLGLMA